MTHELEQLVYEATEITGADPPALMDEDAPVLSGETAETAGDEPIYLVGIIGGKDVGKSSLVNALVGEQITPPTSHGPGTEHAIAYVHEAAADDVRELLNREWPQRSQLIAHRNESLRRQVLLDLPDIDSRYADHIQLTRRMLRHILYPVWIQSIEKYADLQPQRLLAQVAEGNDPANFIFCLNKIDQLKHADDGTALAELQSDFASRIARTLSLPRPPQVFLISAVEPDSGDLPSLRRLLAREKSSKIVRHSLDLATRRKERSLLSWLEAQDLEERAQRLARLEHESGELVAQRIAVPLLEQAVPRLLEDPALRLALLEPATRKRLSRWPIVNVIDTTFAPLLWLIRKNLSANPAASGGNLDAYLRDGSQTISSMVQTTFAHLHQSHPLIRNLYEHNKLWDGLPADRAAAALRQRTDATIQQQREMIVKRAAGKYGILRPPLRWLLTIGALLWFPFVQPILQAMLEPGIEKTTRELIFLGVQMLGVTYLLKNVTFLIIWFVALWMVLRWSTQRRVTRFIERSQARVQAGDPETLPGQVLGWTEDLLRPIRQRRERVESLVERVARLRESSNAAPPFTDPAAAREADAEVAQA